MKNRQRIASVVLAFTLIIGGSVVAAAPAQASVDSNCRTVFVKGRILGYSFYRQYNVIEKLFGNRDHTIYVYRGQGCPWILR